MLKASVPPANAAAEALDWRMRQRQVQSNLLPCVAYLDRCAEMAPPALGTLVRLLRDNREAFRWGQTYSVADFDREFLDNYGWMELFGERGCFESAEAAGGFLLLGPHTHYPDHHHEAEEIYIPLTGGTAWRKGDSDFAVKAAGEVIHHPSHMNHAMRTGDEPLLAMYLWRGGALAEKSTISERPA